MSQDGGKPRYDGNGGDSPQWWPSRWGASDEIGSANELTSAGLLRALGLPGEGRVVDLTQVLDGHSPMGTPPRSFNMLVLAHGSLEGTELSSKANSLTYFEEHAEHSYHSGTHIDGLAHVGIAGRHYNGHLASDIYAPDGVRKLGAEKMPLFLTRGVLLDIAGLLDVERLDHDFRIEVEHLDAAVARQGLEIQPGDAILLHTGWADLWDTDPERYDASEPGIVASSAHWMIERRPSLVGADNWALEVVPPVDPERPFVAHQHLIVESGIYILENLVTRELRDASTDPFLLVAAPLPIRGATGSMLRAAAVL